MVTRREQDIQRAVYVHRAGCQRILNRARHRRQGTLVKDHIDAAGGTGDPLIRAQIFLHQVDVQTLEIGPTAGREVVLNADLVSVAKQSSNEIRTDESGAAGDQEPHARASISAAGRRRPMGGLTASERVPQPPLPPISPWDGKGARLPRIHSERSRQQVHRRREDPRPRCRADPRALWAPAQP